jgi:hypothetical protein
MERNLRNYHLLVLAVILLIGLLTLMTPVAASNAYFRLTSSPSGAYFCIDGYKCDYTPATYAMEQNTYHTITMYMDGYQPWSEGDWTGSDVLTTAVYAQLVPNTPSYGWLNIDTDNADVTVDGIAHGNAMVITLSPGSHTLLLQKAGYDDYQESFTITAGQTTYRAPGMTKSASYGSLQIDSNPAGAAVYVDDNYKGPFQRST